MVGEDHAMRSFQVTLDMHEMKHNIQFRLSTVAYKPFCCEDRGVPLKDTNGQPW